MYLILIKIGRLIKYIGEAVDTMAFWEMLFQCKHIAGFKSPVHCSFFNINGVMIFLQKLHCQSFSVIFFCDFMTCLFVKVIVDFSSIFILSFYYFICVFEKVGYRSFTWIGTWCHIVSVFALIIWIHEYRLIKEWGRFVPLKLLGLLNTLSTRVSKCRPNRQLVVYLPRGVAVCWVRQRSRSPTWPDTLYYCA